VQSTTAAACNDWATLANTDPAFQILAPGTFTAFPYPNGAAACYTYRNGYYYTEVYLIIVNNSCNAGDPPPVNGLCHSNLTYTIILQGLATIEPGKSLPLQATVIDSDGQPAAGVSFHLKVDAVPQSGGHLHGDDNAVERRGTLSGIGPEITPTTAANGIAGFTFDGTAVSGILKFTAWCENRTCSQQGPNTIDVKIEGLEPLPAWPGLYGLIGSYPDGNNSPHPGNHYLTPAAIENAQWLAIIYATEYSSAPRLLYNDASLEWGGVFDLRKNWYTPHAEHQRGTVIDVKANHTPVGIPEENYDGFEWMVKSFGGNPLYHKPGEPTPEHYHVRLMGRKE
jgi:hypothetical protein